MAALVALAACSSAGATDHTDRPSAPPIGADLDGSPTLAAAAARRAAALCATGADALVADPGAYRQETWAALTELVGRAPLADGADEAEREAALGEVRAGWRADGAADEGWDRTEVATAPCADGHLYAVQVLARTPGPADAGTHARAHVPEDEVRHRADVRYGTAPDADGRPVALLLDLFLPPPTADPRGLPTLVLVHGGGFSAGSRHQHADDAVAWARRGFAVATIDYRIDPEADDSASAHRAAAYAAIDDGMEAVRWLRAEAGDLGIDPDRIAALGASAGGVVALGLALVEDLSPGGPQGDVSSRVTAAFSTGTYLTPVPGVTLLGPDDAPVLLHHFTRDTTSGRSWTSAAATCDAVRTAGGTCDLVVGPGADHVVGLGPDGAEADRILAFLAVHLRLDG